MKASKTLPEIIIQVEYKKPLGIREMAKAVSKHPALDRYVYKKNKESYLPELINRYFEKSIYTLDRDKIEEQITDKEDNDNFWKCYDEDVEEGIYRLKQELNDIQQKKLFETRLKHCLEPLTIKWKKDKNGEEKFYSYLIIDLDHLLGLVNSKFIIKFCRRISKKLKSYNKKENNSPLVVTKTAPNIPVGHGAPNSLSGGGPAVEPIEPDDELIKELNNCNIKDLREKIGFHSFVTAFENKYLDSAEIKRAVDVYILDTFPFALKNFNHPGNLLMLELKIKKNMKCYRNKLVKNNFNDLQKDVIEMSDHGLFIAGIIKMLSPQSEIHLIEVLNRHVRGDLRALIWGIAKTISLFNQANQRFCVVNCSFTIKQPQKKKDPAREIAKLIFENLKQTIDSKGFIICSAGNDCAPKDKAEYIKKFGSPKKAMLPATIKDIHGIGALGFIDKTIAETAHYSLIADINPGEGYWAFGGNLDMDGEYPPFIIGNSVISLFASERYPPSKKFPNGKKNNCGWARACGTSFASGVASGTFAALLSKETKIQGFLENIKRLVKIILNRTVKEEFPKKVNRLVKDDHVIPVMQGKI